MPTPLDVAAGLAFELVASARRSPGCSRRSRGAASARGRGRARFRRRRAPRPRSWFRRNPAPVACAAPRSRFSPFYGAPRPGATRAGADRALPSARARCYTRRRRESGAQCSGRRFNRVWKIGRIGIVPPAPAPDRRGLAIVLIVRNEARAYRASGRISTPAPGRAASSSTTTAAPTRRCRSCASGSGRSADRGAVAPAVLRQPAAARDPQPGAGLRPCGEQLRRRLSAGWRSSTPTSSWCRSGRATTTGRWRISRAVRNISLPWHMFGRSGHATAPEGGLVRNYLMRAADPMSDIRGVRQFKCIVDPCHLTEVGVHSFAIDGRDRHRQRPRRGGRRWTGGGCRSFYSADHLQLNHYYTRSEAELAAKVGRGPEPRRRRRRSTGARCCARSRTSRGRRSRTGRRSTISRGSAGPEPCAAS